ncbi:ABC1 kinase family protein [Cryptobacterium curtum]|uniref:ABC1 kinase family protein n=1 Tax=Cryptobacterium curtum TaxID=84163 RepID=UPI00248E29D5|nr:AarF/UbiB family protein [Cryptobacterium curtum]
MSDNTVLKHFFGYGASSDSEKRFDLNGRTRSRRMREIISILRKHHFMQGFTPESFRAALEDLGPSFVKIGQTLSTRSEILPTAYCDELAKLQTECDPLPFSVIMQVLSTIYGDKFKRLFSEVDPRPLGSASLAQVHKAHLSTGDVVAVKVQRPGVRATMAQDIDIMRKLVHHAARFMKDGQMLDLQEVVEEMWATFLEETDFTREADNLQRFADLNRTVAFIDCPKVYPELCSEDVLVMEYVDGIPIYRRDLLVEAGYDLAEIGEKVLDNYATQILDFGFFHADPHPGNILIREGKIVYIDLGIMGRLTPSERSGFSEIIHAVGMLDAQRLKDALIAFAASKDNASIDHARFLADLDLLLSQYGSCDVADLDIGLFLGDVFALTRMSRVTLPSSITNVSRGIVSIEGTIASFIPDNNIINIVNEHIKRSSNPLSEFEDFLLNTARDTRKAAKGTLEAAELSGPMLKMLTRGQLKFNMEVLGSEAPMASLSKIVNRLTLGIITAGLFVGSSLFAPYGSGPFVLGMPLLSFFGYAGAMVLSIWIVVDIWRRK